FIFPSHSLPSALLPSPQIPVMPACHPRAGGDPGYSSFPGRAVKAKDRPGLPRRLTALHNDGELGMPELQRRPKASSQ
ncbi:MAG: hypothetical protein ACK5O7_07440, partial [Holosporales bacterium]